MEGKKREDSSPEFDRRVDKISSATKTILESLGEDPERAGILNTPERYAKAMLYFTKGYTQNLEGKQTILLMNKTGGTFMFKKLGVLIFGGSIQSIYIYIRITAH